MPTYLTVDNLKIQALTQLLGDTSSDTALGIHLDDAEASVNKYLKVSNSLTLASASSTRTVYGSGSLALPLPPHVGTATLVTTLSGYTVPSYVEQDGELLITDSTGVIMQPYRTGLSVYPVWGATSLVWPYGVPFTVTAAWGVSAGTMAILRSVTRDLAVQSWRYKDAGGSETVGAEGAITTVRSGLTPRMRMDLDNVKAEIYGQKAGVY
jgi:hypothetical protein